MKTIIFILLSLSSFLATATEIPDYKAEKVAAHTYVIHGPLEFPNEKNQGFMNNPGFVITSAGVVVIDPGSSLYSGRMVLRQIRKITQKPVTHVFNTHIHGDHWLGNQAFTDAFPNVEIMAHPDMIKSAKKSEAARWIALMEKLTKGATKGTKAVIPKITTDNNFVLVTGNINFKIYAPTKAHSKTDVMIHVIEDSIVFLGDNVVYKRMPGMDDATFRGNIKACDVAIKIGAKRYVPGHGPTGDIKVVKSFKKYLTTIYSQAAHYVDEGLSDFEMKPMILKKLKDFHNWAGFKDEIGRQISLAVIEAEAASFE